MKETRRLGPFTARTAIGVALGMLVSGFTGVGAVGGKWSLVPAPQHPTATNTQLKGVTAISQGDAWAVGRWFDPNVKIHTLHWDGTAWSFVEPPNTSHLGGVPDLDGVDHAPNGDVWAVGNVHTGYPTDNNPLVMRWRNGTWDYVDKVRFGKSSVYPYAERGGAALDVECVSVNDVWVVGYAAGRGYDASLVPMASHWDGSGWTEFEVPWYGNRHNMVQSVSGSGPDDIWAVGSYRHVAGAYHAFMVHWDGSQWSKVQIPIEGMPGDSLWDVAAIAPDDAWAVGSVDAGGVVMHWDGASWTLYAEPSQMPRGFSYLAPVSSDNVWAVAGDNSFWHYDGDGWSRHSNPSVPGANSWWRSGGMAASAASDVWSVGGWSDGTLNYNLTERYQLKPGRDPRPIGPRH